MKSKCIKYKYYLSNINRGNYTCQDAYGNKRQDSNRDCRNEWKSEMKGNNGDWDRWKIMEKQPRRLAL